jgi:SAM-dependent methyltransferase
MFSDNFYTSIAPYYQHIFPFNPAHIEFLKKVIPYNGARILDVGCATGDLAFALTHFGFPIWAFDYDPQMIEIAKKTKQEDTMFPVFEQLDMRLLDQHFPENFFNTIICFGNTLVHLLAQNDICNFLQAAHKTLSAEGKLTIQILNYNYILNNKIESLPLIENEHIRFERRYSCGNDDNLIDFSTSLTIKESNVRINNTVKLNAIRKEKLHEILMETGFNNLEYFGNFKGDQLEETSLQLIVSCRK